MSSEQNCITSLDGKAITGVILKKNPERILSNLLVTQAMCEGDWVYVSGGGRGNPSRFERESNTDQHRSETYLTALVA